MKVLLDTCVWGNAKEQLLQKGHDTIWAGDWPEDPGDLEILELAHKQNRVLVTLDKDFGETLYQCEQEIEVGINKKLTLDVWDKL